MDDLENNSNNFEESVLSNLSVDELNDIIELNNILDTETWHTLHSILQSPISLSEKQEIATAIKEAAMLSYISKHGKSPRGYYPNLKNML